jgi:hypothetical protein
VKRLDRSAWTRLIWSVVAVVVAASVTGCGSKSDDQRPVVVLITDVSGSTKELRDKGGEFDVAIKRTVEETARNEGQLWARPVAAQAVASGTWVIDGEGTGAGNFEKGTGGSTYEADILQRKASKLADSAEGRELLKTISGTSKKKNCGSDLLGAIRQAGNIFSDHPNQPKALVLLTDGGVCSRGIDVASNPPASAPAQEKLVGQLRSQGEVNTDYLQGVTVWAGGVGRGSTGNDGANATAILDLWTRIIKAEGGKVGDIDTSLNLTGFPPASSK